MELRGKFQGAPIAESNPEDHPVQLVGVLFLETADQLRLELGRKFQGAKLSNPTEGGRAGDKVSE